MGLVSIFIINLQLQLKIIETGTHKDLLENKHGVYSRLFRREAEMGNQTVAI